MSDIHEWRQKSKIPTNEICAPWGLPLLPERCNSDNCRKYDDEKPRAHWPKHELPHEDDNSWSTDEERFVFITDSQIVQKVICGHAGLTNEKYRALFQRLMKKLVDFIDCGMLPPNDISDPVQWRRREYNKRADWLCNKALDTRSSFCYREESIEDYRVEGVHWESFSDGACRGDGFSAFSWITDAVWTGERHRFTLAFGYTLVEGNHSSFATELWGLDKAAETLQNLRT